MALPPVSSALLSRYDLMVALKLNSSKTVRVSFDLNRFHLFDKASEHVLV